MAITTKIDCATYQWDNRNELIGWFKKEELDGTMPLPSQFELYSREIYLEELIDNIEDVLGGVR